MAHRLDDLDFIDGTWGDSPSILAAEDIITHVEQVTDTAGKLLFASVVRHHDEPREINVADFPQLRVTLNATTYDNPTVQFHPIKGSAVLDFWILFYVGDTLAHEAQRERFVHYFLRSLSDPGEAYNPASTSVVYSQPLPGTAGFGFQPRYTLWEFAVPSQIVCAHAVTPPFKMGTGIKATRVSIPIEFWNNNQVFS